MSRFSRFALFGDFDNLGRPAGLRIGRSEPELGHSCLSKHFALGARLDQVRFIDTVRRVYQAVEA